MATFVLVHGAWTGAHGWRAVRRLLATAGHDVFTPSLTGVGEREHLTSPQVDLTTHVQDVVNQLLFEDLRDVVLVGFSYGGAVVTAALEHIDDADSRDAPSGGAFWDAAEHARASARWRYHEIETSHMVASNRPEALATVLQEIAASPAYGR